MEARGAAQHPTVHETAPTPENDPAPDVGSAEVGKPCCRVRASYGFLPLTSVSSHLNLLLGGCRLHLSRLLDSSVLLQV